MYYPYREHYLYKQFDTAPESPRRNDSRAESQSAEGHRASVPPCSPTQFCILSWLWISRLHDAGPKYKWRRSW